MGLSPELEAQKRRSNYISYGLGFVYLSMFTFVLPSMYHFLVQLDSTDSLFYGICLSAFSFSRLLFAPLYGYLSDRYSVKPLVIAALCVSAAGNLLYALSRLRYLVLVARLLDGIAAGSMASVISYLTRSTTLAERTPTISNYWGFSMIAVIVSPAAGVGFAALPDLPSWFSNVTAPGYFMVTLCVIFLPLVAIFFQDLTRNPEYMKEIPQGPPATGSNPVWSVFTAPWTAKLTFIVYFVLTYQMAAYEMLVTPYVDLRFGWGILPSGLIITGVGVFLVAANKLSSYLSAHYMQERTLILIGCAVCTAGVVFLFQFFPPTTNTTGELVVFFIGSVLTTIGFALSWPIVPALFSKIVGTHPHKGTLMGVLTAMASLSRIVAPIISGTSGFLTNTTEAVMFGLGCLAITVTAVMYRYVDVSSVTPAGSIMDPLLASKHASQRDMGNTELIVPLKSAEAGTSIEDHAL